MFWRGRLTSRNIERLRSNLSDVCKLRWLYGDHLYGNILHNARANVRKQFHVSIVLSKGKLIDTPKTMGIHWGSTGVVTGYIVWCENKHKWCLLGSVSHWGPIFLLREGDPGETFVEKNRWTLSLDRTFHEFVVHIRKARYSEKLPSVVYVLVLNSLWRIKACSSQGAVRDINES